MLELVFDGHAPVEQFFQAHAQLFQRRGALLQVEVELLAALDQAHGLAVQALQRLAVDSCWARSEPTRTANWWA